MKTSARFLGVGVSLLVLGVWFLALHSSQAADDKDPRQDVIKLAEAIEKNGPQSAAPQADELAKKTDDLGDIMGLFRLRAKKGLGVGTSPGAVKPDGIEALIINFSKRPPRQPELKAMANDLARAAYESAAIALVAARKCPIDKKQGEKDPKKWKEWCDDMRDGSLELAKAAQGGDPKEVKTAANKLNSSCTNCHGVFRE